MSVRVKLHSALKKPGAGKEYVEIPYCQGLTVAGVLSEINVPQNVVGVILLNGEVVSDTGLRLPDGSELDLYPIFAGG